MLQLIFNNGPEAEGEGQSAYSRVSQRLKLHIMSS